MNFQDPIRNEVLRLTKVLPSEEEEGSLGIGDVLRKAGEFLGFVDRNSQPVTPDHTKDYFMPFMLSKTQDVPTLVSVLDSQPELAGSDDQPDIALAMSMLALRLGTKDKQSIEADTQVTMRIDVTEDENAQESRFDNLKWVIASSIKLYNEAKGVVREPEEIRAKSDDALGKRPIEIPGGLGQIRLTMTKHKQSVWRDAANLLVGDFGQTAVSMLGLPAVAGPVMNFVDQLLSRMFQGDVIFDGGYIPFAFSAKARSRAQALLGSTAIVSCLNPGLYIIMRNEDYYATRELGAVYSLAYKRLFPKTDRTTLEAMIAQSGKNPFDEFTYAVFQFRMREAKFLSSGELSQ